MKKKAWVYGTVLLVILTATAVYSAYHHEGEMDSPNFLAVYPDKAGTKLDHCALCHAGGKYESKPGKWVTLGSCQWCHYSYGYDASGDIQDTLNDYGKDYLNNGRSQAALLAIEALDSDGDGYTNIEEINAERYPGNADDDPGKVPAPSKVYTKADLEAMTAHTQFLLMNASRSDDNYAEYTGVPMEELLKDAGVLGTATGITLYAPDGWSQYHPLEYDEEPEMYPVRWTYPDSVYYYNTEADMALNPADGWCDYSSPSSQGRKHLDPIVNPNGNKMILAYKREGQYMDPGILNEDNKLDNEGPFRVVPPQKVPGPPDQRSTAGSQDVLWPYNEDGDHNSGAATRTTTIIKVLPLPPGTTDIDVLEAGWTYVDQEKIIVYGAIGNRGGARLATDTGSMGLWDYDGSTWAYISGTNAEGLASWENGLAVDRGTSGIWNYDGSTFALAYAVNPEHMAGWSGGLALGMGAEGLWNLKDGALEKISGFNPEGMVAWGEHLFIDFGASGIWEYDGSSLNVLLYGYDAESMASWTGGIAVDFGAGGLSNYDGEGWTLLIDEDVEGVASWSKGLAVNFGPSWGLYTYDGANWSYLSWNPEGMIGWSGGLALDYGAFGLWNYDGSAWLMLTPADCEKLQDFNTK